MKVLKFLSVLILVLTMTACGANKTPEPIQPLTKITMDPDREVIYEATRQAWLAMNPVPLSAQTTPGLSDPVQNPDAPAEPIGTPLPQGFYQLKPGETVKCIARRLDIDWLKLYSMNNISFENESTIQPGTVLILPQNAPWNSNHGPRASAEHPVNYSVQAGDTLNSIACIYGDVTPEQIALANKLTSADQLIPGLNIKIP
jgi:nucleoid-associated protein YgaU